MIRIVGNGQLAGRVFVDIDEFKRQRSPGGFMDPFSYISGQVPVTARGILKTKDGLGQFHLASAEIHGVPLEQVEPRVLHARVGSVLRARTERELVHPDDDEVIFCVEGRGEITFEERDAVPIVPGSLVSLPAGLPHRIEARFRLSAYQRLVIEHLPSLIQAAPDVALAICVDTLVDALELERGDDAERRSASRLFMDGVVVSVLNPKIAVFFLAFLPQFVDPARGAVAAQIFTLGLLYVMLALLTDGMYAVLAASVRHWIDASAMRGPVPRYASGAVYIGLGVSTAISGRKQ